LSQKSITKKEIKEIMHKIEESYQYQEHFVRVGLNEPNTIFIELTGHIFSGFDFYVLSKVGVNVSGINFDAENNRMYVFLGEE